MTDLSQFDFIKIESNFTNEYGNKYKLLSDMISANSKDHNFIAQDRFNDQSGCFAICKKCKVKVTVSKIDGEIKFHHTTEDIYNKKHLSCNELMIKRLIE